MNGNGHLFFIVSSVDYVFELLMFIEFIKLYYPMGSQIPSKYEDRRAWASINKQSRKEVLQQNQGGQKVEKHMIKNLTVEEVRNQSWIYECRNKKSLKGSIQILQMRYIQIDDERNCQSGLCDGNDSHGQLVLYTEHLNKLYENNSKIQLKLVDQFSILRDIIDAIETLVQKFGYFAINKEMVGFNSRKIGKVWINQNFACNRIQLKPKIQRQEDHKKWERQSIENLINICFFSVSQSNSYPIKFHAVIQEIRKYQLFSFVNLRNYMNQFITRMKKSQIYQSTQEKTRLTNKCRESMIHCNNFHSEMKRFYREAESSTRENQKALTPQKTTSNCKNYLVGPVVFVKNRETIPQKEKQSSNDQFCSSYHFPLNVGIEKQHISQHYNDASINVQSPKTNYVHVNRRTQSFIIPPQQNDNSGKLTLIPVCSTIKHSEQILTKSNKKNKQVEKSEIQMIDSMFMVQKQSQLEGQISFIGKSNIILQESVILRG